MPSRFGSVVTAMATPFRDDLSLDLEGAQALARHLLDHGSESLVVYGSTGEAPTLSDAEKRDLTRAVVEVAGGRAKVIANTGTYDTRHSIELTAMAAEAGADAVLLVTPYYSKPPQRGLIQHFGAIAGSTELPVILYNIPGRTACRIENETLLRLAGEVPNVVAVKDATGDLQAASHLIREAPEGFEVYSGDDWAAFPLACLGGVGVISVASHLAGDEMRQMFELLASGDVAAARKIHLGLTPLFAGLFCASNPIPLKAALTLRGLPAGPPRSPLQAASEEERAIVAGAIADSGLGG